jgi:hypothetical protein
MPEVTRQEVKVLRTKIESLLDQELGNEYKVLTTKASYGEYGRVTIEFYKKDKDGQFESAMEGDFRFHATSYGLEPTDLGARFNQNGMTFEIIGLKPRNRKYPVIAKNVVTQQSFKFAPETLVHYKSSKAYSNWTPASEVGNGRNSS